MVSLLLATLAARLSCFCAMRHIHSHKSLLGGDLLLANSPMGVGEHRGASLEVVCWTGWTLVGSNSYFYASD